MPMTWMQQSFVQFRFIAQEEESLGVGVEPANRINVLRKAEVGERTIWGAVRREPGEHTIGLVECDQHDFNMTKSTR